MSPGNPNRATADATSFEDAFRAVDGVEGWLSREQARVLYDRAARLAPGHRIVEIGSHHGRSTVVLALASREGVEIVAIDPFERPERPPTDDLEDADAGERDLRVFQENLARAGVRQRVRHVRERSSRALPHVVGPVDLLYVDGAHEYAAARSDISDWGDRVPPGGFLLVHDSFSSVGVTLAQLRLLFPSRQFRYLGRSRSLAEYRREPVGGLARAANAAQQAAQLPWFLRNVLVKLSLVVKARPLARLLGHRGDDFPH